MNWKIIIEHFLKLAKKEINCDWFQFYHFRAFHVAGVLIVMALVFLGGHDSYYLYLGLSIAIVHVLISFAQAFLVVPDQFKQKAASRIRISGVLYTFIGFSGALIFTPGGEARSSTFSVCVGICLFTSILGHLLSEEVEPIVSTIHGLQNSNPLTLDLQQLAAEFKLFLQELHKFHGKYLTEIASLTDDYRKLHLNQSDLFHKSHLTANRLDSALSNFANSLDGINTISLTLKDGTLLKSIKSLATELKKASTNARDITICFSEIKPLLNHLEAMIDAIIAASKRVDPMVNSFTGYDIGGNTQ